MPCYTLQQRFCDALAGDLEPPLAVLRLGAESGHGFCGPSGPRCKDRRSVVRDSMRRSVFKGNDHLQKIIEEALNNSYNCCEIVSSISASQFLNWKS